MQFEKKSFSVVSLKRRELCLVQQRINYGVFDFKINVPELSNKRPKCFFRKIVDLNKASVQWGTWNIEARLLSIIATMVYGFSSVFATSLVTFSLEKRKIRGSNFEIFNPVLIIINCAFEPFELK